MPRPLVIGLALLALAAAGCGGTSSGDDDPPASPQARAEFAKRGDAICTKMGQQRRIEAEQINQQGSFGGSPNRRFREGVVRRTLLPAFRKEAKALAELEPPAGDEDVVADLLTTYEEAIAEGRKEPSLLFKPGQPPFGPLGRELARYGFKVCGAGF